MLRRRLTPTQRECLLAKDLQTARCRGRALVTSSLGISAAKMSAASIRAASRTATGSWTASAELPFVCLALWASASACKACNANSCRETCCQCYPGMEGISGTPLVCTLLQNAQQKSENAL